MLGGTGAIGIHLVKLLSNKGVETYVTSRIERESKGNTQYIKGNAHDIAFVQTLLAEEWDAIVDFLVYSTEAFRERVDLLLGSTKQYVFLSSARVYAEKEDRILETSARLLDVSPDEEFQRSDEYSLAKARQEDILKYSGRTNWTIVRPYITYSENRLQLGVLEKEDWLYRALQGRTIVFSKDICSKLTTLTYSNDVANCIFNLIGNKRSFGETFHIATEETIKWEEVLELYLDVLEEHIGKRPKVLLQDLESFIEWKGGKYQVLYDRLYNRSFNGSKLNQFVEMQSFEQIASGLRNCLQLFLEKPSFRSIYWKNEALKDRNTKEVTPMNEILGFKQKVKYILYRWVWK